MAIDVVNAAGELFGKGMDAVTRGFDIASLSVKKAEVARKRKQACADLGESLFEAVGENDALRAGREDLFKAIEDLNVEAASIEEQLARFEEEKAAKAAEEASKNATCPQCGFKLAAYAKFCENCGAKIDEAIYEPAPDPLDEADAEEVSAVVEDVEAKIG